MILRLFSRSPCCLPVLIASQVFAATPACEPEPGRFAELISGAINGGEVFQQEIVERWVFRLQPSEYGWIIQVSEQGRDDDDLSILSTPFYFGHPRFLDGWHFRNAVNTGPNDGSVNQPQRLRNFIFSPEVGRSIFYRGSATTVEEINAINAFGRGWLYLDSYTLTPPAEDERAAFEAINFTVCLTWPM